MPHARVYGQVQRVELLGLLDFRKRLIEPPHRLQIVSEEVVGRSVARVYSQCLVELLLCPLPVPVVLEPDQPQRCMRFGERRVKRQRPADGLLGLRVGFIGRDELQKSEGRVAVCEARVCPGEGVIRGQGLLEKPYGLSDPCFSPGVPGLPAAQVIDVSLRIAGVRPRPLSTENLQSQCFRNPVGDVALYLEYVADFPVILLRPLQVLICGVHQLDANADPVPCLPHATFENVPDAQLSADFGDRFACVLVLHDGRPGNHPESPGPRHRGDELLCQPVGKVLLVLVLGDIRERKNCDPVPPFLIPRDDPLQLWSEA